MKHLFVGVALGVLCVACSSVADITNTAEADIEATMPERAEQLVLQTLPEIAAALESGDVSSEELVTAYLMRIEQIDRSGPTLQSVLAVNPNAMADAQASDARRAMGKAWGPLDGVPILLKDNIESLDPVATTAGALALKENVTGRDSPLVAGMRAQGAIILGKTNLSQWRISARMIP